MAQPDNLILLVDDDQELLSYLKETFEVAGFAVEAAESSEAAMEIIKQTNIKIMFLDLHLPGISGVELCKLIRKDYPLTSIFAVTGYHSFFELAACREAGFDDYFFKPVSDDLLIQAAQQATERLNRWKKGPSSPSKYPPPLTG